MNCEGGKCPEPMWCEQEGECLWHKWNSGKHERLDGAAASIVEFAAGAAESISDSPSED